MRRRGPKTYGSEDDQQRHGTNFEHCETDLRIAAELDTFRDDSADNHHPPRRNEGNGVLIVGQTRLKEAPAFASRRFKWRNAKTMPNMIKPQ